MAGSDLELDAPREVIGRSVVPRGNQRGASFDTAGDGRILISNNSGGRGSAERQSLLVVLTWLEEVERLAPKR